jgi:hypothetical protein
MSLALKFLWQIRKQKCCMKNSWQRKDKWTDPMWVGKQQEQIHKECFKNKPKTLAQDDPLWWKFQWMVILMVQP